MSAPLLRDRHPEQAVEAEVGHLAAIEGLRGVAVLLVVAFHYWVLRKDWNDPWVQLANAAGPALPVAHGYLGVDLFFLITGFLLTLPWFRHALEGRPAPDTRDFYVRRVRRIVPAYYVHLALLVAAFIPLVFGLGYWWRNLYHLGLNIPAHFAFFHYFSPLTSSSFSLNGALWTLALEAQYYLLLPLLAPLFVRAPWRTAFAFLSIAIAWRWMAEHDLAWLVAAGQVAAGDARIGEATIRHLIGTQLPAYLGHFAVGIVIGRAWLLARIARQPPRPEGPSLAMAAFAVYLVYAVHGSLARLFGDFTWVVIPLCFGIAVFALLVGAPRAGARILGNAPLRFVGRVSYSLYLYHLPLLFAWNLHAPRDLGWAGLPAYLAAALAVAWLSYRFVEQPFLTPQGRPWPKSAAPGASEAPSTSATTTKNGDAPSTTTASSSSS